MTKKKKTAKKKKKKTTVSSGPVSTSTNEPKPDIPQTKTARIKPFEELIDQQKNQGQDEPKKRGRPRKDQGQEQPPAGPGTGPDLTDAAISAGVKLPFNLWALSNNLEQLKLKDKEAAELAAAVKALMEFYCPDIPVPVILWGNLSLTAFAIMAPRLEIIKQIKAEKEAREKQQAATVQQTVQAKKVMSSKFPSVNEISSSPSSAGSAG